MRKANRNARHTNDGLIWFAVTIAVSLPLTACGQAPQRPSASQRAQRAERDLAQSRERLASVKDEYSRWLALTNLVVQEAGEVPPKETREHAREVLTVAEKYRRDWNYGNAVHKANLALGRVAARENNLAEARDFLLRAGRTPGSPQLNSFGPNMMLAKELLARGERQAVLDYFKLCAKFWRMDHGQLERWAARVNEGVEPDFGGNLVY